MKECKVRFVRFIFDIRKAIAAAGVICQRKGGSFDMLKLIKAIYLADKWALLEWHRPITGDSFYSLENGPIVSRIYDLIRGRVVGPEMDAWYAVFHPRFGDTVSVKGEVNLKPLSRREKAMLERAAAFVDGMTIGELIDYMHSLPEWKAPGKSSIRIEPKSLFYHENLGEEAVEEIERDVEDFMIAKASLQARPI